MHNSIGQMKSSLDGMRTSVDSLKSKVDDLVAWKNRILGGAVVLGVVSTALGILIGKASEYITLKPSVQTTTSAPSSTLPTAPAAPTPTPRPASGP
jgi:hypothetical protein